MKKYDRQIQSVRKGCHYLIFNGERNRLLYSYVLIGIIILGLLSRVMGIYLPEFLHTYAGDTLWGAMVFVLAAIIFSKKSTTYVMWTAILFAYTVECSQLIQTEILLNIRSSTFGGLLLGHGFLLSDIICYTVGIMLLYYSEKIYLQLHK